MTGAVAIPRRRLHLRLVILFRDLIVGAALCLTPVTAILALGWLSRHMACTIHGYWGAAEPRPGWLMGPPGTGRLHRLIGGLAANIRAGILFALGLFALTLPITLAWLGAWWAGWENSFNKGYEQASIGPLVWGLATLLSLPVLAHLPLALAHGAAEGRLAAMFELGRIRSVGIAAGWRLAWLALLSALASIPFFGMRAIPVFIEDVVPGFEGMTTAEQAVVAGRMELLAAALAFCAAFYLRHRAAVIYARAAPRAAQGRSADAWAGHPARSLPGSAAMPMRVTGLWWLFVACLIWLAVPVLIVFGQFMNYDPVQWLIHPVLTLPWAG